MQNGSVPPALADFCSRILNLAAFPGIIHSIYPAKHFMLFKKVKYRNPWTFVPSLYFIQGLPNVIITGVLDILYKRMGLEIDVITSWTGLLNLPWTIKMLWAPWVDIYSTKRNWILAAQLAGMCCLTVAAFSLQLPNFFVLSLLAFTVAAFMSATYDIAADGFYMLALTPEQQAFFAGIRNVFFRIAILFSTGFLVVFAGQLEESTGNIPLSWTLTLGLSALILGATVIYHKLILPYPEEKYQPAEPQPERTQETVPFSEIIKSYFQQNKVAATLAFILMYRFAEVMLGKIAKLFLLDSADKGGLAIATKQVGFIYGTVGVFSLIAGGVIGGALISKYGLRKSILPMAFALNLPDLVYVYMAYTHPPIQVVYGLVSIEQFGYGLGFTAFMVYLMYAAQGEYKTSHYAISTGFMALGRTLAEVLSGHIQKAVGYPEFFIIVCLLTIPGMLTIFFLPLDEVDGVQRS